MHKNYRKNNTSDIDAYSINSYFAGKKSNETDFEYTSSDF